MNGEATMHDNIIPIFWTLVFIGSMYLAGRIAERRGRSFKNWALLSALLLGPLTIPLVPTRRHNGNQA